MLVTSAEPRSDMSSMVERFRGINGRRDAIGATFGISGVRGVVFGRAYLV